MRMDPESAGSTGGNPAGALLLDRSLGALYGAVSADAAGTPTRFMSRAQIDRLFSDRASQSGEGKTWQNADGLYTPNRELGRIFGDSIIEGRGHIQDELLLPAMTMWADGVLDAGGVVDAAMLSALQARRHDVDSRDSRRFGDTNGCLPGAIIVGLATPSLPLSRLVERVQEACRLTHNTCLAIAGAAAVAAAVSTGVEGAALVRALRAGEEAAVIGADYGYYVPGASVAERIQWALDLVASTGSARSLTLVSDLVGTGIQIQETVPAAFAVALLWPDDPWRVCLESARLGGDTSMIGAAAAAMVGGALGLRASPDELGRSLGKQTRLRLGELARALMQVRLAEPSHLLLQS